MIGFGSAYSVLLSAAEQQPSSDFIAIARFVLSSSARLSTISESGPRAKWGAVLFPISVPSVRSFTPFHPDHHRATGEDAKQHKKYIIIRLYNASRNTSKHTWAGGSTIPLDLSCRNTMQRNLYLVCVCVCHPKISLFVVSRSPWGCLNLFWRWSIPLRVQIRNTRCN